MTRNRVSEWHQQALNVAQHLASLETEVARLKAENAALRGQIEQIEQAGGTTLSPEIAIEIGKSLQAQPYWDRISLGKGGITNWDTERGIPQGGGLLGLLDDLRAIPGDDVILGVGWDARERSRSKRTGREPRPRPSRFFNHDTTITHLRGRGNDPVSADTLHALTTGLGSRTLKAAFEAAFLLWGTDTLRCLREDPEMAVATLASEIERAYAEASATYARMFAEMFNAVNLPDFVGKSKQLAEARALLGIDEDATGADIKRAYHAKAKEMHPDQGGNADAFNALSAAYQLLTA